MYRGSNRWHSFLVPCWNPARNLGNLQTRENADMVVQFACLRGRLGPSGGQAALLRGVAAGSGISDTEKARVLVRLGDAEVGEVERESMTATALPARCRWVEDADGGRVVYRRTFFERLAPPVLMLGTAVVCSVAVGFAGDGEFLVAAFAPFMVASGLLAAVALNFVSVRHELRVRDAVVVHWWRRPVGLTRTAVVAGLWIRHHPERVDYAGVDGERWELTADYADGQRRDGLWSGTVPQLQALGERLHSLTGLTFAPEPRDD